MEAVSNFIGKNSWALVVVAAGIVGTYSVNAYRISVIEKNLTELKGEINVVNQMAIDIAVLRERTENQSNKLEEVGDKVDSIIDAFKIKS